MPKYHIKSYELVYLVLLPLNERVFYMWGVRFNSGILVHYIYLPEEIPRNRRMYGEGGPGAFNGPLTLFSRRGNRLYSEERWRKLRPTRKDKPRKAGGEGMLRCLGGFRGTPTIQTDYEGCHFQKCKRLSILFGRCTPLCKIIPACLNFRGLASASLINHPQPSNSAIFWKIGGKTINLAGTFLHNGVNGFLSHLLRNIQYNFSISFHH